MDTKEVTRKNTHRYLFTLEVALVEVGKVYEELPAHLTLMSRFFSGLSADELTERVRPVFEGTQPLNLIYGDTEELGPKRLIVHMIQKSDELKKLHEDLRLLLNTLSVEYEYPAFIGKGHKPHVSSRDGLQTSAGIQLMATTVCLIEVVDKRRVIRSKFELSKS